MTEGSEWKLILLFTLPLMAGNFLQQLYNAVDGIVVGNFAAAGENALAAVGTCAPITMLFIAVAMGMSTGCSILIAQLHGARQYDEMRKAVATSLILVICRGPGAVRGGERGGPVVADPCPQGVRGHFWRMPRPISPSTASGWCSSLPITSCPLFFGPWEIRRPHYISCWCHR